MLNVTPAAERDAKALGLDISAVRAMARQSAPYTHPLGTRRFDDYVLDVVQSGRDKTVRRIGRINERPRRAAS